MTAVDTLWYLADEARREAERTYHRLAGDALEFETTRGVSRNRFRTVAERIERNGAPFGTQTLVVDDGRLLLVYHAGVDMWVLPGGETRPGESFREGAARELREEAGIAADYEGLGLLGRVRFRCDGHTTWGVLPVFAAEPVGTDLSVEDPDDEISDARWFPADDLPADTRDREHILDWYRERGP
jgi:ADP-ribose pyrophosphatase YjhB (NUDIX family)